MRHALASLNTTSAPGIDNVNNKLLRNLDDKSISALTEYYNHCFDNSSLPSSWKTAKVIFIPKPNKPSDIANLRPISLTSCLGKTLEHVMLNRFNKYAEDNQLFPPEMIGFRQSLSCQDAMLRLKHDLLTPTFSKDTQAILGLDLRGAFNNIDHGSILRELNVINCGRKMHDYIREFLTNRTAIISLNDQTSPQSP